MPDFNLDKTRDNYCVMGNPVKHSKSPEIHSAFARQTGQDIYYQKIEIPVGGFTSAMQSFHAQGGKGMNITLPFKRDAWQACTRISARAEQAQAVNLIDFAGGEIYGDNSDGIGLVRDLTVNHQIVINGKSVLVLGAGGAVRGILGPLLEQAPGKVVIANRTFPRATELVEVFADYPILTASSYEALAGCQFDVVINGTSASLSHQVPPLPDNLLNSNATCYDMMYSDRDTAFVTWAKKHHAVLALDGLGMLVEQAAESFHIWRGIRPDTTTVIQALRTGKL